MAKKCKACKGLVSGPYYQADRFIYHPDCFNCSLCFQALPKQYILKKGLLYHGACYQTLHSVACHECQQKITGKYIEHESKQYHPYCYKDIFCEPCDACGQALDGRYLKDIWGNKTHGSHGGIKTRQCHVCSRLISDKTSQGGVKYGDGRHVCGFCRITEVTTLQQVETLKKTVLEALESLGFLDIPSFVAVSLADQKTLNKRLKTSSHSNSHGFTKTIEKTEADGRVQREHSIFILHGLPRIMFSSVLAHELLHVWINDRGLRHLSPKQVEGLCNLGAAFILQSESTPLAGVLLNRLESDPDPVYGQGYRNMKQECIKKGWATLIQEIAHSQPSGFQRFLNFTDRFI